VLQVLLVSTSFNGSYKICLKDLANGVQVNRLTKNTVNAHKFFFFPLYARLLSRHPF